MLRLIVNADDFGESPFVNAAVFYAFRQGIVTSASLMVTAPAFEQAVALARACPGLRVGLHVVLLDGAYGSPCAPPAAVPHLVNRRGRFPDIGPLALGAYRAALRWWVRSGVRAEMQREIRAQVDRFLATGLPLDHLDSHYHLHAHPVFFDALMDAAEEVGVRRIRLPVEPWGLALRLDRRRLGWKIASAAVLAVLGRRHRRQMARRGFPALDGCLGILQALCLSEDYLVRLLRALPEGTYELHAHPRLDRPYGLRELRALTSPRVRQVLVERGVRLTTYSEVIPTACEPFPGPAP